MTALLRGADRAALAAGLARRLREAGVAVGVSGVEAFAAALAATAGTAPFEARRLYWLARVTLVSRHDDLAAFDRVFAAAFGGAGLRLDPAARRAAAAPAAPARAASPPSAGRRLPRGSAVPGVTPAAAALPWIARTGSSVADAARAVPDPAASTVRAVAATPFEVLDPEGLARMSDSLAAVLAHRPVRRSRRTDEHPRGTRVLPRATLARSTARGGGEPLELAVGRARAVPRRLVVLCDVSRSMQPYATAYLHLARAAARAGNAEVYAFSHDLTRLTPVLSRRGAAEALELATERVTDRFGGTRIATSVRALLADRHARECRGAVVLVASDGWDGDDPALLRDAMARLRRRAHRVVWVNPRVAAAGFAPLAGGMAAALPHCDALLPGHTLEAMTDVAAALRDPRQRPGGVSSRGSRAPRGGSGPSRRPRRAASPGSPGASGRTG
jgi:uncharacterized protein with von Willebrand factor type A (vWA) domain